MAYSVAVQVLAAEPLREAGIVAMLRSAPALSVRRFSPEEGTDVIVADLSVLVERTVRPLVSSHHPRRPAVVITDDLDMDVPAVAAAGVVDILYSAEATRDVVLAAVDRAVTVFRNAQPVNPADLVERMDRMRAMTDDRRIPSLTELEAAVLGHLARGSATREIVQSMSLSERTVKYVLWRVMSRFSLHNRVHAVAFAIRAGFI